MRLTGGWLTAKLNLERGSSADVYGVELWGCGASCTGVSHKPRKRRPEPLPRSVRWKGSREQAGSSPNRRFKIFFHFFWIPCGKNKITGLYYDYVVCNRASVQPHGVMVAQLVLVQLV